MVPDHPPAPAISVLLPTTQSWPALEASLASLLGQRDAPPFEILVLDGNGAGFAASHADHRIRCIVHRGADAFQLRMLGVQAARGAIIASTEDHCIAPPEWLSMIAEAHARDDATALLGPTANHRDSSVSAIDRANFVLTFAGQNTTRIDLSARHLPAPTNLSFKRGSLPSAIRPGDLEYAWLQELKKSNHIGVATAAILQHRQSWGKATPRVHFASGRSFGASVRAAVWRARVRWWAQFPSLPIRLLKLALPDLIRGAGGARVTATDVLCLLLLIVANVFGQAVGVILGAGSSRHQL